MKGLYKKALEGRIIDMTGVQDPYEEPINSEITVDTEHISIDNRAAEIPHYLDMANYLRMPQPV